jgi:nitrile hydratase accessory protein
MNQEALRTLPGIPLHADGPIFNAPWEAKAFAMAVALHERGLFTWPQWAEALSRQIKIAQAAGDADLGDTYYQHWLLALESLVKDLPPKA